MNKTIKNKLALVAGAALMATMPVVALGTPAEASVFNTPCAKVKWSDNHNLLTGESAHVEVTVKKRCSGAMVTIKQDGSKVFTVPVTHRDGLVYSTTGLVEHSVDLKVKIVADNGERIDSWSTYKWVQPKVA